MRIRFRPVALPALGLATLASCGLPVDRRNICFLLLLLLTSPVALGQFIQIPDFERRPSAELISEGVAAYDVGSYEEAIEYYLLVHPNDTNYYLALDELTLAYMAANENEKALTASNELGGLDRHAQMVTYHINRGAVLERLGKLEEAVEAYRRGAMKFPFHHLIHYNAGITEYNRKNFKAAYEAFMESARAYPYHRNSLLFLGQLELNQGHFSKALLAFMTAIAVEPENPQNRELLETMERLSAAGFAINLNPAYRGISSNKGFVKLDLLLQSKVALRNKSKLRTKVGIHEAFLRQVQLLLEEVDVEQLQKGIGTPRFEGAGRESFMESLEQAEAAEPLPLLLIESDGDPWRRVWAAQHKEIWNRGLFDSYAHVLLVSTKDEGLMKRFDKVKKNLDPLYGLLKTGWNGLTRFRRVSVNGEDMLLAQWYSTDLKHAGALGNEVDGKREGYWRFYQRGGLPLSEGFYKNGKMQGPWRVYDEQGILTEAYTMEDGKLQGKYSAYEKGVKVTAATYAAGEQLVDTLVFFYPCGSPKEKYAYVEGKRNGPNYLYYESGALKGAYRYENDMLSGAANTYYAGGEKESELFFEGDVRNGNERSYHPNGELAAEGQWLSGARQGVWNYYDQEGRPQARMSYDGGALVGLYEWYENGKKAEELSYFNGEYLGKQLYLDTATGNPYAAYYYSNTGIDSIGFFNPDTGELLSRAVGSQEGFEVQGYDSKGRLSFEGGYLGKEADGNWTQYHPGGEVRKTYRLDEGQPDGMEYVYWPTGSMKEARQYQEGRQSGYEASYYPHEQLQQQGWVENGRRDGPWELFYPDGTRKQQAYYIKGELFGWQHYYTPDGTAEYSLYQEKGIASRLRLYGKGGELLKEETIAPNKPFRLYHPNGAPKMIVGQTCYLFSDKMTWRHPNGQVESEVHMSNGNRKGEYRLFSESGQLLQQGKYEDGLASGEWKWYDEKGRLLKEGMMKNGELQGWVRSYYSSGTLKELGHYHIGQKHGVFNHYGEGGELLGKVEYENGAIRRYASSKEWVEVAAMGGDTLRLFYPNGRVASSCSLLNGYRHGLEQLFYKNGQLKRQTSYEDSRENGEELHYWENGKLSKKGSRLNGGWHGSLFLYDQEGRLLEHQEYRSGLRHGLWKQFDPDSQEQTKVLEYWNGYLLEK